MNWQDVDLLPEPEPQPSIHLPESAFQGCRFIAGQPVPLTATMFCGKPTLPGSSFCKECRAVCYERRSRRPRLIKTLTATGLCQPRNQEPGHARDLSERANVGHATIERPLQSVPSGSECNKTPSLNVSPGDTFPKDPDPDHAAA
jgi:hypothetical protein